MLVDLFTDYAEIPADEVDRLLTLPAGAIYQDKYYLSLVTGLNASLLHDTAGYVRQVYEKGLPEIKVRHNLADTVMSGYTLCNWVLGYLNYPSKLSDLLDQHGRVSVGKMVDVIPDLVGLLAAVPEGRAEWTRAFLIITLPLLTRDNE